MRLSFLLLCVICLAPLAWSADAPNVVLVITDDQGYGDLSCHGNPVLKTPAIDQLFGESIRLTDYHVSPTCSPTRAALLTGHWTNRTGVWHTIAGRSMLRRDQTTVAEVFRNSGYSTGMFGTDVFFDAAKQFIDAEAKASRPFFVYLATNAPHGPMHAPPEYAKPYLDAGLNVKTANFFGMIANIDQNVGSLREFLAERNLVENTIFIFTTDNGSSAGAKVFNDQMRGAKGSAYDGGHRVPFFIRYPGRNLTGPKDVDRITAHVDILPTLIDLCELTAPEGVKFDGQSLMPLIAGEDDSQDWPDRMLVTDSQRVKDPIKWRACSVMTDRWRLIDGKQLFDMENDRSQKIDVASANADVVERLRGFYDQWWAELEPSFSKETHIMLGHPATDEVCLTSHDWATPKMTPWNQSHIRGAMTGETQMQASFDGTNARLGAYYAYVTKL